MFITPSFEKSLIVEQFQGNHLKCELHRLCDVVACIKQVDRIKKSALIFSKLWLNNFVVGGRKPHVKQTT